MVIQHELGQPAWQILTIILFLIPGLNATWMLERFGGRSTLPAPERLFRAVAWSVLLYLATGPLWIPPVRDVLLGRPSIPTLLLLLATILFVAPFLLALGLAWVRRRAWFRGVMRRLTSTHPAPTAWDFAFSNATYNFVRVNLRSGEVLGGLFGPRSFAAAYPQPGDVFVEQGWLLDEEQSFIEPVDRSQGFFVSADAIERVEFLSTGGSDAKDA